MSIGRIVSWLLAVMPATGVAQSAPLFHYELPSESTYTVERNVRYAVSDGVELFVDIYRPQSAAGPSPVVLMYSLFWPPAGSARSAHHQTTWARIAAGNGIVAVIPDLRAVPGTGTAQGGPARALGDDFHRALSYLLENGSSLEIDTARVSLFAVSGAVTPALRALADSTTRGVAAAVLYYGGADTTITRFPPALRAFYVRAGQDSRGMNAMVERAVSLALRVNADLTLINYAAGHHAFEYRDDTETTRQIVGSTVEFLKRGGRR